MDRSSVLDCVMDEDDLENEVVLEEKGSPRDSVASKEELISSSYSSRDNTNSAEEKSSWLNQASAKTPLISEEIKEQKLGLDGEPTQGRAKAAAQSSWLNQASAKTPLISEEIKEQKLGLDGEPTQGRAKAAAPPPVLPQSEEIDSMYKSLASSPLASAAWWSQEDGLDASILPRTVAQDCVSLPAPVQRFLLDQVSDEAISAVLEMLLNDPEWCESKGLHQPPSTPEGNTMKQLRQWHQDHSQKRPDSIQVETTGLLGRVETFLTVPAAERQRREALQVSPPSIHGRLSLARQLRRLRLVKHARHTWPYRVYAGCGAGDKGQAALWLVQLCMLMGMFWVLYSSQSLDGICPRDDLDRSAWARGTWFTALIVAIGRRLFWGSNSLGVDLLVDTYEGYSSASAFLVTVQLVDVMRDEEWVCNQVKDGELLTLLWTGVALLGWYSAWNTLMYRVQGREDKISVMSMVNPLGLVHYVMSDLLLRRAGLQELTRQAMGFVFAVLCAAGTSLVYGAGGLGGMSTAILLVALGGLKQTIGADRLLWMLWWTFVFIFQSGRVSEALTADGFDDFSEAVIGVAVAIFLIGRSIEVELLGDLPGTRLKRRLLVVEPVGRLVAAVKDCATTLYSSVATDPVVDAWNARGTDPERLKAILSSDNVDKAYFENGRTLVHQAVLERDVDRLKTVLDKGAKAGLADQAGDEPLQLAMRLPALVKQRVPTGASSEGCLDVCLHGHKQAPREQSSVAPLCDLLIRHGAGPTVQSLQVSPDAQVDGQLLLRVAHACPRLRSLDISNWNLVREMDGQLLLSVARAFPQLRRLNISNCNLIHDTDLQEALNACSQLSHIVALNCVQVSCRWADARLPKCRVTLGNDLTDQQLDSLLDRVGKSLRALCLPGNGDVTDTFLQRIAHYPQLQQLDLRGCENITDRGLAHLKLQKLQQLDLRSCKNVTDRGLAHLKELKQLLQLDLSDCTNITDGGLAHLEELKQLQQLNLCECTNITDGGLAHLQQLKLLQRLDLRSCKNVTDRGLAHLKELKQLLQLDLSDCTNITDGGLSYLKQLQLLQRLDLSSCKNTTDGGLAHLEELKQIRWLDLSACLNITDGGLAHLQQLKLLQRLDLSSCKNVTDRGLAHLKELKQLQQLNLSDSENITDSGLAHLKELKQLQRLDLSSCENITDGGLAHLNQLKQLQQLNLQLCGKITDGGLAHLKELKQIRWLDLSACLNITDGGLSHLKELKQLQELHLKLCCKITDNGLSHLRELKQLQRLNLSACYNITDGGLAYLKELKQLELLNLQLCGKITDGGLAHLKELKQIRWLDLSSCKNITDGGLAHLKELKQLQELHLQWCKITDGSLAHLKGLKMLQRLNLRFCENITSPQLRALHG